MNLKILLSIVIINSFIVFGLLYITTQRAVAYDNFGLRFIAYLDPDQIVSDYKEYGIDSNGVYICQFILLFEDIPKYFLKA